MAETSTKPYMIRALYEWCCDNGYTPYLAVAVDRHTLVPRQHVQAGQIVLNVSPLATSRLTLGNELVEFQARFSGVAQQISIPVANISAIYARETGHGMAFDVTRAEEGPESGPEERNGGVESGETAAEHSGALDENEGGHAPASSVRSLRGGARRRGPRSVERDDGAAAESAAAPAEDDAGQEASSRKRPARGQGSADVIAFAPSDDGRKKKGAADKSASDKGAAARGKSDDSPTEPPAASGKAGDDDDDPPPADGGGVPGARNGKARLTRIK